MRSGGIYALRLLLILLVSISTISPAFLGRAAAKSRVEANIFFPGSAYDIGLLNNFESELDVNFTAAQWYQDWATSFDTAVAGRFHDNGYIPELTWEPQSGGVGIAYGAVVSGNYDTYISETATRIRSLGYPIRISLAPEMNTDWTPWGIGKQGNNRDNHKLFWRHVVQKFREAGTTNVQWIWSPNVRPWNAGTLYGTYADIFPGSDYVDYMGLDGYNWGTSQSWSEWQSFSEVFGSSYTELAGVSNENILIMETASAEAGGSKAAWITDMFAKLQNGFPRITGFTWFHINKETDWRLTSSSAAATSFSAGYKGIAAPSQTNSSSNSSSTPARTNTSVTNPTTEAATDPTPTGEVVTTVKAADNAYAVLDPVAPKVAGSLVAGESWTKHLFNPQLVSLWVAMLFGMIIVGGLSYRRLKILRQPHHSHRKFFGFGLVDGVFVESRLNDIFPRNKSQLRW